TRSQNERDCPLFGQPRATPLSGITQARRSRPAAPVKVTIACDPSLGHLANGSTQTWVYLLRVRPTSGSAASAQERPDRLETASSFPNCENAGRRVGVACMQRSVGAKGLSQERIRDSLRNYLLMHAAARAYPYFNARADPAFAPFLYFPRGPWSALPAPRRRPAR